MAQTSDASSAKNLEIEWSSDNSTWTDLSGSLNNIDPPEGVRMMGSTHSFDGDTPIITSGKRETMEISFEIIYTETDGEAFEGLLPYYTNGSDVYLRWFPLGSSSGSGYKAQGPLSDYVYPGGDAGSGDPIMTGATLVTPEITRV